MHPTSDRRARIDIVQETADDPDRRPELLDPVAFLRRPMERTKPSKTQRNLDRGHPAQASLARQHRIA
ncbi:hypothetical protein OG984_09285 [Nocardioides sp. NBC_00368]|uniref:hypothetical protein n=1 Tax=Nocardioides sp. NBC_00368 TaxID=2976000 RepID=UPI002E211355